MNNWMEWVYTHQWIAFWLSAGTTALLYAAFIVAIRAFGSHERARGRNATLIQLIASILEASESADQLLLSEEEALLLSQSHPNLFDEFTKTDLIAIYPPIQRGELGGEG